MHIQKQSSGSTAMDNMLVEWHALKGLVQAGEAEQRRAPVLGSHE